MIVTTAKVFIMKLTIESTSVNRIVVADVYHREVARMELQVITADHVSD
jgi:hypothetical protein